MKKKRKKEENKEIKRKYTITSTGIFCLYWFFGFSRHGCSLIDSTTGQRKEEGGERTDSSLRNFYFEIYAGIFLNLRMGIFLNFCALGLNFLCVFRPFGLFFGALRKGNVQYFSFVVESGWVGCRCVSGVLIPHNKEMLVNFVFLNTVCTLVALIF